MSARLRMTLLAGVAALAAGTAASYVLAKPAEKVVRIDARRFQYTPGELKLKKGEAVVLEFTSRDVLMGFNLPDFKVRADMVPDKVTRVRFVPDKSGTFTFVCDIFCGSGHEEMHGTLRVVD